MTSTLRVLPLVGALLTCLVVAAGPSGPAQADGDRVVVRYGDDLPPGVSAVGLSCPRGDGDPAPATTAAQGASPGYPSPLGDDALSVSTSPATSSPLEPALLVHVAGLSDLATLGVDAVADGGASPGTRAVLDVATPTGPWRLDRLDPSGRDPWQPHDFGGVSFLWHDLSQPDAEPTGGTLVDFVAAHGDGATTASLEFSVCGSVEVDALRFGPAGSATTFDFERAGDTVLWPFPQAPRHRSGGLVLCQLDTHGSASPLDPLGGRQVDLLARPYGARSYRLVGTTTTSDDHGVGSVHVHPRTTTVYRCRFDGDGPSGQSAENGPVTSQAVRMRVGTRVGLHVSHQGRRVVATGSTSPAHPGARLELVARAPHQRQVTVAGVVSGLSTYRITARLPAGRWRLRVTEDAVPGNAPGHSPTRTVRVG